MEAIRIKKSRIVVPFYRYTLSEEVQKELELEAKSHGKSTNSDFLFANLDKLNKSIARKNPNLPLLSWGDILNHHLVKWVIIKTGGEFESLTRKKVNKLVSEYFTYMPFITQRMWRSINVPFGAGFDKELQDKDYKRNDYARYRLKEQFKHELIDKLMEVELIDEE